MGKTNSVTTYSPKKVTLTLGSHIAKGFADDSFITIDPAGDGINTVVGCDGEIVRSLDPNDMYSMKITLLQTSKTNQWLENQFQLDNDSGKGTFPVNVKDLLGNEKFASSIAWVVKPASWVRGKTQNNREWEIAIGIGGFQN